MSSVVAGILGLPPGVHFQPDDDELVEYYLLPRARGEPVPFAGVAVVDEDAAGSTLPWDLLDRHGRGADNGAYFFVRGSGDGEAAKPGAREERGCGGGGTWKSQKRHIHTSLCVAAGEKVGWSRHNLNLHMGRGKSGGSVGWVMHEYALTDDPSCPTLKICHVAFTGHGKNRKRVPGGGVEGRQSEPASKRARVNAAASGGSGSTTTTVEQDYSGVWRAYADHVGPVQVALTGQDDSECPDMLFGNELRDMLFSAPPPDAQPCSFDEYVPSAAVATTEQQVLEHAMMMPLPMVQQNAGMAGFEQQQYPCGRDDDDDHKQFLASFGITLDQLCDMTGIGDMDVINWEGL